MSKHANFTDYFIENYAVDTLINGNISECIRYLRGLLDFGKAGIQTLHEELIRIKTEAPEKYNYVLKKVFS